jgi:hypothetical protein
VPQVSRDKRYTVPVQEGARARARARERKSARARERERERKSVCERERERARARGRYQGPFPLPFGAQQWPGLGYKVTSAQPTVVSTSIYMGIYMSSYILSSSRVYLYPESESVCVCKRKRVYLCPGI